MNEILIVSLFLLATVLMDAIGDALRFNKELIAHHVFECIHIALWFVIWYAFGFEWVYIAMYVLGRIIAFDIVFNLAAGLPLFYIGNNSLYDIILTRFGGWVKQHPGHFVFIFRFMALVAWVGLIIKN